MPTPINENPRISDVLMFEEGEEVNYVRDAVTLANGTAASTVGTVLGQQTVGAVSKAAKSGGNTGAGSLTLDATTPALANALPGVYTVRCTIAGVGSATFRVVDPKGAVLGDIATTATFADRVKFVVTSSGADYIVGDGFDVTVAAGNGKFSPLSLTAVDGTGVAAAVLLTPVPATLGADATVSVVDRGPAILKSTGLVWPAGASATQIAAFTAQLQALGMPTRSGYGV